MFHFFHQIIPPVYAALPVDPIGPINIPAGIPQNVASTGALLSALVRFLVVIAGIFTLWQFLSGSLAMITSNGDKGKLTEAQNKIQSAILGLVVMAASFIIIAIISKILFDSFSAILIPEITPI